MNSNLNSSNNAKFAFFYLLSLVMLLIMSISTGVIIFQIINIYIIDLIDTRSYYYSSSLHSAVSSLIISAPIYFFVMRQIYKNLFSGDLSEDSPIRKWLTYFILLITAIVMATWLISVLNNFMSGELTLKFILKALTSIGIAAIIFGFYLYDIKRTNIKGQKNSLIKIYFFASLSFVVAVLITAFLVMESPAQVRENKKDQALLNNFHFIQNYINDYYTEKKILPADLEELSGLGYFSRSDRELFLNPSTKEKIEYKILNDNEYELCHFFHTSNLEKKYENNFYNIMEHDSGYQCLKFKAEDYRKHETIPAKMID